MNKKNNREKDAPCRRRKGKATKDDCDHCIWRAKIRRGGSVLNRCSH